MAQAEIGRLRFMGRAARSCSFLRANCRGSRNAEIIGETQAKPQIAADATNDVRQRDAPRLATVARRGNTLLRRFREDNHRMAQCVLALSLHMYSSRRGRQREDDGSFSCRIRRHNLTRQRSG